MSEFLYFMSMAFPMIHKSAKNEGKSIVIVIGQENMFMSSVQDNFWTKGRLDTEVATLLRVVIFSSRKSLFSGPTASDSRA